MNKNNYNLVAFIAVLTVMTSCKKEDIALASQNDKAHKLTINVREEDAASSTRTAITGRLFTWATEDSLGLYTKVTNNKGAFKLIGGQGTNKGAFEGSLQARDEIVYAAYPYRASTFTAATYTSNFVMSQAQEHLEGGALDSTSIGDYALMFGQSNENVSTDINTTTGVNISMEHLTAVFDLKLTDLPNNTTITELYLQANSAVFPSKVDVDLASNTLLFSRKQRNIKVTLFNSTGGVGVNTGTNTSLTIRLAMLPTTVPIDGNFTISLTTINDGTTTKRSATKTFLAGKEYKAGVAYDAPLSYGEFTAISDVPQTQPNLILINIDDLGWADVGYNSTYTGSNFYETPNIDRLKEMGVSFHHGYASAANSAPSRACMLSGQYTPRHEVYTVHTSNTGNLLPAPTNDYIPSDIPTLPMALRDKGYNTCHVGKWHVGSDPTAQGIDLNIGGNHTGAPEGGHFAPEKNPQIADKYNVAEIKGQCLTKLLGDAVATYIDTISHTKPFFLYYAPYSVHTPMQADATVKKKYQNKSGKTDAHKDPTYAAMIEAMDNTIGTILDALKAKEIEENTVIVFTSDNGGVYSKSKQWPLRAGKGSFYEGGIREPFLVYQKGKIEGGRDIADVSAGQIDIFPTFMELAGISYTGLLDGESLVPILTTGDKATLEDRYLYWHFPDYLVGGNNESTTNKFRAVPLSVVRHKEWKLIRHYDLSLGLDEFELYNIATDVSEKTNLAADINAMPADVKTKFDDLCTKLDAWIIATNAPIPQPK